MNTTRTGSITHTIGNASYDVDYVARWYKKEKQTWDYPGCEAVCEIVITKIVRETVISATHTRIETVSVSGLDDEVYDALIEKAQQNERDTEWPTEDDVRDRYQEARDKR